jgi:hypothetical protein
MNSTTQRDWIATYDPDDPELRAAVQRRRRTWIYLLVPVWVVLFTVFNLTGDRLGPTGLDRWVARTPDWVALATFLVGWVAMIGALALSLRPAPREAVRRNPYYVLTLAQRRRAAKQLRGALPVEPHEVPFLRDVARARDAQRWGIVSMVGVLLLAVSAAMFGGDAAVPVPTVLVLVPVIIGAIIARGAVDARRFLRSVGAAPV